MTGPAQVSAPPTRGGTLIHAGLVVLGVTAAVVGAGYGVTIAERNDEVGAGFLPVLAGSALALFAGVEVVKDALALRAHRGVRPQATAASAVRSSLPVGAAELLPDASTAVAAVAEEPAGEEPDIFGRTAAQRRRLLLVVSGLLLAAVLAIPLVGFLISFGLLLLVLSWRVEHRRLLPSVVTTVVVVAVTRLVFVNFLGVPLPSGLLGVL